MNKSSLGLLIVMILVCEAVGFTSAWLSMDESSSWFTLLNKPAWHPPTYVFGPVWSLLFILMAVSVWFVALSDAPRREKNKAYALFALQLFLNFWWSILFFRHHLPAWAFLDILLMIVVLLFTIFSFAKLSRVAAYLLVPYISWVFFAAALNYSIWILNP